MKKLIYPFFLLFFSITLNAQIQIDADFENGNVEIIEIIDSTNTITFLPALENDSNTTRCWFYFKIYNYNKDKPLIINIKYDKSVQAPNFPVYSYDNKNWEKVRAYQNSGFKQVAEYFTEDTIFFATGFPYTFSDLKSFLKEIEYSEDIGFSTLTKTQNGVDIPKLLITDFEEESPKSVIWIITRQHTFESHSNYVLEGIINYLISENKEAKKFRKNNEVHIIPMMDIDNVILGASGRMQTPIDFNRDWNPAPQWEIIEKTISEIYKSTENKEYSMFFDIHSTYPGGNYQLFSYFDIYMKSPESENMNHFWDLYTENAKIRPIKLSGAEKAKGYVWADQYNGNRICPDSTETCFRTNEFSLTLECEWNKRPDGEQWTIENITQTGEFIGEAICRYMNEKVKNTD